MKRLRLPLAVLLAATFGISTAQAQWGDLSGRLVYDGPVPSRPAIRVTKDVEFCGKHDLKQENLVVNPENGGLANVVVALYSRTPVKAHSSYEESADKEVHLDNTNCRFEPRVVLLRTSQTLVIGNDDPIGHNTKIDTVINPPINPIVPANGELKVKFTQEERFPIPVSCSIHPWMSAKMIVKDHPYMAVTDKDGKFTIKNAPAGKEVMFQAWHEESGYVSDVSVDGKAQSWRRGIFTKTLSEGQNEMGEIKVSPKLFDKS